MHGTFPQKLPQRMPLREAIRPWTTLGTSVALASIPLVLAAAVAILRFGSKVSLGKILAVLVAATNATPM